eukprot:CAMPEP_0168749536 /NCGR_PEP_ID=MMETSP0724-20121128/16769_1 /TAXON_ID=265536 /ORGANISM="Amphiprora sp., Strain CCMP467" /LENGTH=125 /DNA_ID=CAMNT_0008797453 /DNA_START=15 /DNA_END=392 /DNA_ORIENTATION=+
MSDEDICHRVSKLPDRVLLGAFDKPLGQELANLSLVEKTALRVWWFNPNAWPELERTVKLQFIRFLLDKNHTSQHQIAEKLKETVTDIAKTLCGYNAVKGVCQAGFDRVTRRNHNNKTSAAVEQK